MAMYLMTFFLHSVIVAVKSSLHLVKWMCFCISWCYVVFLEDKGVQIDLEGGTAFPSNRRKILSSSSLASQVLQRARNRNNEFWSKWRRSLWSSYLL